MITNDKVSFFKEDVFPSQDQMALGFKDKGSASEVLEGDDPSSQKLQESFSKTFKKAVDRVNDLQKLADRKIENFSTGKSKNIPEVMIAVERADLALKLMVKVRNKIVEAYQEIMRMQV